MPTKMPLQAVFMGWEGGRPRLHGRLSGRLVRLTGEEAPGTGEMARPAHDLDVRPMPLVTADEMTHWKGPMVDALRSLGDASMLPAGGSAVAVGTPVP